MCGIAGIWGDANDERLRAMANALRHRGPDEDGSWFAPSGDIGLTHTRLSIVDLQTGRQPISNEDGQITTVFNGEIYNYRELRQELIAKGHQFRSQGDTEVLVHLYEEDGEEFVTKLRGMFAIALWDAANQQLVLARDRVGKKPLYYGEIDGDFLFASEIKGIRAAATSLSLNRQAIADYLTWTVIPGPGTIYTSVQCVEPGTVMVVRERRVARASKYWQLELLPKTAISKREAIEQVDASLRDAVRMRMHADVPVGCFLSGGIDSSIITAIAAEQQSDPLTTITIGFDDAAFDERPLARLVADRYGTDHHEIVVKPNAEADLVRMVSNYDQPFGDSSAIPSYYAAQAARQFVKVVLNGDGGDELFAGYRRYVGARLCAHLSSLGGASAQHRWQSLLKRLPVPRRYRSKYAFAHRLVRGMGLDPVARYLAWSVDAFDAPSLSHAMSNTHASLLPPDRHARTALATLDRCGPVDRMLGADFSTILPYDLLVKMDIATMAHGLEARSPLLDQGLIETVARFPEHLKLPGLTTKPLLRSLAARYVPTPQLCAPKRGFEVPLVSWLQGELRPLCEDVILSSNGLLTDWFARPDLERLLRGKLDLDPARWARRVWLLLVLGMWDRVVYRAGTR